jgi:hypothetical protein
MTGVALAVIFVLAVAIALAVVPPATPATSAGRQANARAASAVPSPTRTTIMARPPIAFVGGTTHDAITISWQKPHPLPVGYRIYRATGRFAPYTLVGTVNEPDLTSFTDAADLTPAATYAYTVTAFDGQQESAPSAPVVAVLLPGTQPTVSPTPTAQPLGPLPTFAPIAPATLTAIAHLPQPTGTPLAVPGASTTPGIVAPATIPGIAIPTTSPVSGTAIPTPVAGAPTIAAPPTVSALTTATPVAAAATLVPLPTRVSVGPAGVPTRYP